MDSLSNSEQQATESRRGFTAVKVQRKLLWALGTTFGLTLLGLISPLNQPGITLHALPALTVFFSACFLLYAVITIWAYRALFRYWRTP